VFVTEKIGDGLRSLLSRATESKNPGKREVNLAGRWNRAQQNFVQNFMTVGELVVREGVRVSELRPEDDAEANQPVLESALFLVARSRLFQDEPASAVPLLKGLFRTANRTGRPFSVDLVRHDLPLTEEDRLWMARKGGELVGSFVEQGHIRRGGLEAQDWAQVILQLLQARYFGGSGRLAEERSWLEAVTADRLLGRAVASVDFYRSYLAANGEPGPRSDEARVRLLELLGNTHAVNFAVPRYAEALSTMQATGLSSGSAVSARFQAAIERFEYRCPEAEAAAGVSPAWASVAVEADGRIAVVFWWDNEPRDLAFWTPGDDAAALNAFLVPCEGRLLAANEATLAAVAGCWQDDPAPWSVVDFVTAVMECRVPANGLDENALSQMALAETGPWRSGWRSDMGHDALEPPTSSAMAEVWQHSAAASAIQAGLVFLAVRSRIAEADISVRAGIGEMARRGDAASQLLYEFLTLQSETQRALDASFEAWTLPLLWTRPDPFGWTSGGNSSAATTNELDGGVRPDLGRSDLTIVTTGNAPSVLAAWGDGKHKWRVILDRMDRLETLTQVASAVVGPVTLIPQQGRVHVLPAALHLLEEFLSEKSHGSDGLLAIFHWTRLVETHNGDLLDFQQVRPRPGCSLPLYERYAEMVTALPTEAPSLALDGSLNSENLQGWGGQFSQRVRKAGLVAGTVDHLGTDALTVDSLWGVFEGSDAAWVFLDSAAVHWSLQRRNEFKIPDLHALLHSRGNRHLSILSAAHWQRSDLEELLAKWLHLFGNAYCLSLTDTRSPALRLVDRGIVPEAEYLALEELSGQLTWITRKFSEEGPGAIQVPQGGRAEHFWRTVASGSLPVETTHWHFFDDPDQAADLPEAALVVPVLQSLNHVTAENSRDGSRSDWLTADVDRSARVRLQRQMCALEIAAISAGHWRSVEILDSRWWRLLRPEKMSMAAGRNDASSKLRQWDGEQAAQLATNGMARVFDLPGTGVAGESAGRADSRALSTVAGWLQENQNVSLAQRTRPDSSFLTPGTRLYTGDLAPVWHQIQGHLGRAWERGELDQWALIVADEMPPGAQELVANSGVSGVSIWSEQWQGMQPAPVLWVEPEDFGSPELKQMLKQFSPTFIIADDLADWLPSADRDAHETAVALRGILDCDAKNILLRASSLTNTWSEFLAGVCQATCCDDGTIAAVESPEVQGPIAESSVACIDCGAPDRPSVLANRLQILLSRLRQILASVEDSTNNTSTEMHPALDRQLLPLPWLARLAGISSREVSEGVMLLRWAARLNGDTLSAASEGNSSGKSLGHSLLVWQRFSDLELNLSRLRENLALLLPLWLEGVGLPGLVASVDLERPPAQIDSQELAQVDAFLSALSGNEPGLGLTYHCPRGLLNSATRIVGWAGASAEMMPAILHAVETLQSRIGDLMTTATETGAGFRIDTGLTELRIEERNFLGIGVALGFWRWIGPSCPDAIHVVDLLTVADSSTVKMSDLGWDLFKAQAVNKYPVAISNAPALVAKTARDSRPRLGQLRRLLTVGVEASDDLDSVVGQVYELTKAPREPAFLVLKGMLGTGRHEALVRGLIRTLHQATDPGGVTVFCPDEAVAAMIAREFTRHGYGRPVDIRTVSLIDHSADVPAGPGVLPALADPGSAVIVMCEAQRFDAEARYRVAQMGRGKLLLMTADEVASVEGWEHLFLTTPRANDIVNLPGQRHICKSIWTEVSGLAPDAMQPTGGTRRHERGQLESGYAANLVQSLARVVAARQEGVLPHLVRLTTPLATDLDYLGAQLREHGWLAVPEAEIDKLALPGPREILAAATDQLALSGEITRLRMVREADAKAAIVEASDAEESNPSESKINEAGHTVEGDSTALLTPLLLGPEARRGWQLWRDSQEFDGELTLAEFVGSFIGTPWANTFLKHSASRRRSEEFLAKWGGITLCGLMDQPMWEVWWHNTRYDLGLAAIEPRRPACLLSDMARVPGCRVPGGVYLCVGSEPIRQHYEFLGRVTDSALVLYQDRSPLPRDQVSP
ncbi:MAG: hypothetical protein ACI8S7_000667, partial [Candidatus Krumholzibacteriia bacterium]